MSKVSQAPSATSDTSDDEVELLEGDSLQDSETDLAYGNVDAFAARYNLIDNLPVLHQAARLLRGNGSDDTILRSSSQSLENKWHQPTMLWFTVFCCSLGAINQGWSQTGINGVIILMDDARDDANSLHSICRQIFIFLWRFVSTPSF